MLVTVFVVDIKAWNIQENLLNLGHRSVDARAVSKIELTAIEDITRLKKQFFSYGNIHHT